jgi:hypothetical protein
VSERDAFDNLPEEDRKTGEKQHSKIFDLLANAAFYLCRYMCQSVQRARSDEDTQSVENIHKFLQELFK